MAYSDLRLVPAESSKSDLDAASVWHVAPHLALLLCGGLLAAVAGVNVLDAAS